MKMKNITIWIILCSLIALSGVFTKELHDHAPAQQLVDPDPELEKYLREAIENFREQMKEGIPAIKMPVLDPLELRNLDINVDENLASLDLKIREFLVKNLSIFNVTSLKPNLEELFLAINLTLPVINLSGDYILNGKLLKIFPIYGQGHFDINATNVEMFGGGELKFTSDTLQMRYLKLDFSWKHLLVSMENFLGGGDFSNVLQKAVPVIGRDIFHVYKPLIMETMEKCLADKVNEKLNEDFIKDIIKGIIPRQ